MHGNILDGLSRTNNPQSTSFVLLTVVNYLARKSKAVLCPARGIPKLSRIRLLLLVIRSPLPPRKLLDVNFWQRQSLKKHPPNSRYWTTDTSLGPTPPLHTGRQARRGDNGDQEERPREDNLRSARRCANFEPGIRYGTRCSGVSFLMDSRQE
jgi:hypothetical protein